MYIKRVGGPNSVRLADGSLLTLADLPPVDTERWVVSRKLTVVRAVMYGLLSRDEALERYAISDEEFQNWVKALSNHGVEALKVTHKLH